MLLLFYMLYNTVCYCLLDVNGGKAIPAKLQGQVEQVSEQPDPVVDAPAHCRGLELADL